MRVLLACVLGLVSVSFVQADDWPHWRGPTSDGVAPAGQNVPTTWSETENILWKASVPGRGHSSPTIVGNRLFLTTAREDKGTQSVLCYDVRSGDLLWDTEVLSIGLPKKIHKKNTHASGTVACDGKRVFASFYSGDSGIHLIALSLDGKELWRVRAGDFVSEYPFGYGGSPVIAGANVAVAADWKGSYLAAYDRATGKPAWRTPRGLSHSSYSSPIVGKVNGKSQILMSGGGKVSSYNISGGQLLWEIAGGVAATAGTVVWNDELVFASGGYPKKLTWATNPVTGKVVWTQKAQSYEQSMVLAGEQLYAVAEGGIAYCWDAATGEERWRERLGSGAESASPVLVGDLIYATNERGQTFVYRADPDNFEILATNRLGDEIFATPTVVNNRIYIRSAEDGRGGRAETLWCIGFGK